MKKEQLFSQQVTSDEPSPSVTKMKVTLHLKRFFIMLLALFAMVGETWADDYSVGQYNLTNVSTSTTYYAFYSADNSTSKYGGTTNASSAVTFKFEATGVDGEYYWYDVTNSKYIYAGTSGYLAVADTKDESSDSYKWYIIKGDDGKLTITDKANYNSGSPTKGLVGLNNSAGGWMVTSCTLTSNTNSRYWQLVAVTSSAVSPAAVTAGWYQIKWYDVNSDTKTGVATDYSGKFVTCYETYATVNENKYPLYLGETSFTNVNDLASTFVYVTRTAANVGTACGIRSTNGKYVSVNGTASTTNPNDIYIIYRSASSYPTGSVMCTSTSTSATRYSWLPMVDDETSYIGQSSASKFPIAQYLPVDLSTLGLQEWTVQIEGGEDETQVQYTGSSNFGLDKVYNNGTFFFASDVTPSNSDFTASTIDGFSYSVSANSTAKTITVTYESDGDYETLINNLCTTATSTVTAAKATTGYGTMGVAPSVGAVSTLEAAITTAQSATKDESTYTALQTAISNYDAVKSYVQGPLNGHVYKMYSLQSGASKVYMTNGGSAINFTAANTEPEVSASSYWKAIETVDATGKSTYTFKCADGTKYFGWQGTAASGYAYDLTKSGSQTGCFQLVSVASTGGGTYLYLSSSNGWNRNGSAAYSTSGSTNFGFEEVTDYTLYNVVITGAPSIVVPTVSTTFTISDESKTFSAANGGTLISNETITDDNKATKLTATMISGYTSEIAIADNTITVTYALDASSIFTTEENATAGTYTRVRLNNVYFSTKYATGTSTNSYQSTLDVSDANQLWALVGTASSFKLYNIGAQQYIQSASNIALTSDASQAATFILDDHTSAANYPGYGLRLTTYEQSTHGSLHLSGGTSLIYWTSTDGVGGSMWSIQPTPVEKTITVVRGSTANPYPVTNTKIGNVVVTYGTQSSTTSYTESSTFGSKTLYLPDGVDVAVTTEHPTYGFTSTVEQSGDTYTVTFDADTQNKFQYLWYTDTGKSFRYRIPAIAVTRNGDVVAINDRRYTTGDVGNGRVDQVIRYSSDNGTTWDAANGEDGNLIIKGTGDITNKDHSAGFGDPAVVVDRETGKMLMVTVCGYVFYGNVSATATRTEDNTNRVARFYSTDNGRTWGDDINGNHSTPTGDALCSWDEITDDIYGLFDESTYNNASDPVVSLFAGSGKIFQSRTIKVGDYYRIYIALCAKPNGNRVIYSDDFGQTWKALGGASAHPATGGDEPKCEELPNGDVILSSRIGQGRAYNIYTYSTTPSAEHEAEGSWGTAVNSTSVTGGITAKARGTNGEILVVQAKRKSDDAVRTVVLQTLPWGNSGDTRSDVGFWWKDITDATSYQANSANDVTTFTSNWTKGLHVTTKLSAYSTMVVQQDGKIAFYMEDGPDQNSGYQMVYAPLTISEITGDTYSEIISDYYTSLQGTIKDAEALLTNATKLGYHPDTNDALSTAIATAKTYTEGSTPLSALTALQTAIDNYNAQTVINKPVAGTVITIQNKDAAGNVPAEKYLYVNTGSNKMQLNTKSTASYFLVGTDDDGKTTLQSIESSLYVSGESESTVQKATTASAPITITAASDYGYVLLQAGTAEANYMYVADDTWQPLLSTNATTKWILTDVTAEYVALKKDEAQAALDLANTVGYPLTTSTGYSTLSAAITELDNKTTDIEKCAYLSTLAEALTTYMGESDVMLPEDGKCYTISIYKRDGSGHWNITADGGKNDGSTDGGVFVAHKFYNAVGNERYAFVGNSDGKFLKYQGVTDSYSSDTRYNDMFIASLNSESTSTYVSSSTAAQRYGFLYMTADVRPSNTSLKGNFIINESTGGFDNSAAPYYNGSFTSAIKFTPVSDEVSETAQTAIDGFSYNYAVTVTKPDGLDLSLTIYGVAVADGSSFGSAVSLSKSNIGGVVDKDGYAHSVEIDNTNHTVAITYVEGEEIRPEYVESSATGTSEGPKMLVDDSGTSTKWGMSYTNGTTTATITLLADATVVKGYKLWNGNDTNSQQGRRWKTWTLEGSNDNSTWTTIQIVTDGDMNTTNNCQNDFVTANNSTAYNYYKFTITANEGGTMIQMSDLKFLVTKDSRAAGKLAEANRLLALAGKVGYPTTTSTGYENLAEEIELCSSMSTDELLSEIETIDTKIAAYKAETDLIMPEAGKVYTLKHYVAATTGDNQYHWLTSNVIGVASTASVTEPTVAGQTTQTHYWKASSNDDGGFSLTSNAGASLVFQFHGNASTFSLIPGTAFGYVSLVKDDNKSYRIAMKSDGTMSNTYRSETGGNVQQSDWSTDWIIEEATGYIYNGEGMNDSGEMTDDFAYTKTGESSASYTTALGGFIVLPTEASSVDEFDIPTVTDKTDEHVAMEAGVASNYHNIVWAYGTLANTTTAIPTYWTDAKTYLAKAGQLGYPTQTSTGYTSLNDAYNTVNCGNNTTITTGYFDHLYSNYIAETDVVVPEAGHVYYFESAMTGTDVTQRYVVDANDGYNANPVKGFVNNLESQAKPASGYLQNGGYWMCVEKNANGAIFKSALGNFLGDRAIATGQATAQRFTFGRTNTAGTDGFGKLYMRQGTSGNYFFTWNDGKSGSLAAGLGANGTQVHESGTRNSNWVIGQAEDQYVYPVSVTSDKPSTYDEIKYNVVVTMTGKVGTVDFTEKTSGVGFFVVDDNILNGTANAACTPNNLSTDFYQLDAATEANRPTAVIDKTNKQIAVTYKFDYRTAVPAIYTEALALSEKTGFGYPTSTATSRTTFAAAVASFYTNYHSGDSWSSDAFEETAYNTLANAMTTYYTSTTDNDIELPANGTPVLLENVFTHPTTGKEYINYAYNESTVLNLGMTSAQKTALGSDYSGVKNILPSAPSTGYMWAIQRDNDTEENRKITTTTAKTENGTETQTDQTSEAIETYSADNYSSYTATTEETDEDTSTDVTADPVVVNEGKNGATSTVKTTTTSTKVLHILTTKTDPVQGTISWTQGVDDVANGKATLTGSATETSTKTVKKVIQTTISTESTTTTSTYAKTSDTSKQDGKTYYTLADEIYTAFTGESFAEGTDYYERTYQNATASGMNAPTYALQTTTYNVVDYNDVVTRTYPTYYISSCVGDGYIGRQDGGNTACCTNNQDLRFNVTFVRGTKLGTVGMLFLFHSNGSDASAGTPRYIVGDLSCEHFDRYNIQTGYNTTGATSIDGVWSTDWNFVQAKTVDTHKDGANISVGGVAVFDASGNAVTTSDGISVWTQPYFNGKKVKFYASNTTTTDAAEQVVDEINSYSSLNLPYAVVLPTDGTVQDVFVVTGAQRVYKDHVKVESRTTLTMVSIKDYLMLDDGKIVIPREFPVIIKHRNSSYYWYAPTSAYESLQTNATKLSAIEGYRSTNQLKGTLAKQDVPDGVKPYILGKTASLNLTDSKKYQTCAFFPMASGYQLPANRVYIDMNSLTINENEPNPEQSARSKYGSRGGLQTIEIEITDDDETTGIENISSDVIGDGNESDDNIYDISGRRLNSQPQHGFYIKNGEKYIAK